MEIILNVETCSDCPFLKYEAQTEWDGNYNKYYHCGRSHFDFKLGTWMSSEEAQKTIHEKCDLKDNPIINKSMKMRD